MRERRPQPAVHRFVGLAEVLTPLAVPDDQVLGDFRDLGNTDLTCKRPLLLPVRMLRPKLQSRPAQRLPRFVQEDRGRTEHGFHAADAVASLSHAGDKLYRRVPKRVHLPVARDRSPSIGHHAPYLVSRWACAIASESTSFAGKVPSTPRPQAFSLNASLGSAGAASRGCSRNGTGCHEWPASTAGVEWSPATMNTSACNSCNDSKCLSSSSSAAIFAWKSPSSPAASARL